MKKALAILDKHIVEIEEQINGSRLEGSAQSTNQLITTKRLLEDIREEIEQTANDLPLDVAPSDG